jgi:hypothetical protein
MDLRKINSDMNLGVSNKFVSEFVVLVQFDYI